MNSKNILKFIALVAVVLGFSLSSCTMKTEPYFSGANDFHMEAIAPEGIKVVGNLWFHNPLNEQGDHMGEELSVYIEGHEKLPVNYGQDRVIRIGGKARYDVEAYFYIPTGYVTDNAEEATLLSNKKLNREITFTMKGKGTVIVGDTPHEMPIEFEKTFKVWPDLK